MKWYPDIMLVNFGSHIYIIIPTLQMVKLRL